MFSQPVLALSCVLLTFSAGAVLTAEAKDEYELKLKSREYKLTLESNKFAGADRVKKANELWNKVTEVAAKELGNKDGEGRAEGSFEAGEERTVLFRDTAGCVLKNANYSFRDRHDLKDGKPKAKGREVTLKLRTPDIFIAAVAYARAKADSEEPEIKFEEDITPLLSASAGKAAFASPASMRSLFSVSITYEKVTLSKQFNTLSDITKRYSGLKERLKVVEDLGELDVPLQKGKQFNEFVLEGPKVDLGKANAKFDLTLWYAENNGAKPESVELSYKYKVEDAEGRGGTPERAFKLFAALQDGLKDWTSADHQTKTSLALPSNCQKP